MGDKGMFGVFKAERAKSIVNGDWDSLPFLDIVYPNKLDMRASGGHVGCNVVQS